MVHMATPWKHPKTGIYYLNRQISLPLRTEFGGRVHWKESLPFQKSARPYAP